MNNQDEGWKSEFYTRFQEEYPHLTDEQAEEIKKFISSLLQKDYDPTKSAPAHLDIHL